MAKISETELKLKKETSCPFCEMPLYKISDTKFICGFNQCKGYNSSYKFPAEELVNLNIVLKNLKQLKIHV